jgi:hypothetical protein
MDLKAGFLAYRNIKPLFYGEERRDEAMGYTSIRLFR